MSFVVPASSRSWVPVDAASPFSLQNLPFGVVRIAGVGTSTVAVPIGDSALLLGPLVERELIPYRRFGTLGTLDGMDRKSLSDLRHDVYQLLREDVGTLRDNATLREAALVPLERCRAIRPLRIPAFVDFYSGINHASNVGRMFRPDMPPLLPNYRWLPVGYNGRASSVVMSGEPVVRPWGQQKVGEEVVFRPTQELDFELEMGFFVGTGNPMGEPIPVDDAEQHLLGAVLVNDWSARDVQRWEYQPLGPFLAKSFCTSISPWIVTFDALEPFRSTGPAQDPEPLPHLAASSAGHFDVHLEVRLKTERATRGQKIAHTNARELYWSFAQQLAHQTSNGTPVEPGDLYASRTFSGAEPGTFVSLLELTWRGANPLAIEETGETRTFLEDGDALIMDGWCQGEGYRVGFGAVAATVAPAREWK